MDKPPPKGSPKNCQVDKKTYNWCSYATGTPSKKGCNYWVIHKPSDYNGLRNVNYDARSKPGKPQPVKKHKAELTVKAATVALKRARNDSDFNENDASTSNK